METLIILVVFVGTTFLLMLQGLFENKKREKQFLNRLKASYGKQSDKEYAVERVEKLASYFYRHKSDYSIDDITWNDLNLDQVLKKLDYTYSSCGEEYLYYKLRTVLHDDEEIDHFESLVKELSQNEDMRLKILMETSKIGYVGKYSIYDYLDNLDNVELKSCKADILFDLLFIPLIVMLPFFTTVSVGLLIALCLYNIITYFSKKGKIDTYIVSFAYITRLVEHAGNLLTLDIDNEKPEEKATCKNIVKKLQKLKRGSSILGLGNFYAGGRSVTGGNPIEIIIDYLKITFHLDIIIFMKMKDYVIDNIALIDELIGYVGFIESCVSISYYRASLDEYALPEFNGDKIVARDIYHPLLANPVKNDFCQSKSILITGSNASGKSTFIKSLAINALFAQTIHTVCAKEFAMPKCIIYSSMALKDDILNGESYYIVETKALKRILDAVNGSDIKVLCFIDEVLRGTNTIERIAASSEVLSKLNELGAFVCAATHDYELAEILSDSFDNYHFTEEIVDGSISFSYKLLSGKATSRNAIKLLEMMGFDKEVVDRANKRAEHFVLASKWD